MEVNMRAALVLGVAALAVSAGAASAQVVYPGYGYAPSGYGYAGYGYGATAPLYDYAAPVADLAPPAYGYAPAAPLYNYAAPAYAAPATSGTTIVIVTPAPAYSAPVVGSGLYNYAPGYWGGGYGRAGYWGGYGYGWR
jgi:hypothetical protein